MSLFYVLFLTFCGLAPLAIGIAVAVGLLGAAVIVICNRLIWAKDVIASRESRRLSLDRRSKQLAKSQTALPPVVAASALSQSSAPARARKIVPPLDLTQVVRRKIRYPA
jgi:hypothetical protein